MKKFVTLFGVALLAGTALYSASAQAADELTITSWGGPIGKPAQGDL
jgi:spermidine/putrescine-binding protein